MFPYRLETGISQRISQGKLYIALHHNFLDIWNGNGKQRNKNKTCWLKNSGTFPLSFTCFFVFLLFGYSMVNTGPLSRGQSHCVFLLISYSKFSGNLVNGTVFSRVSTGNILIILQLLNPLSFRSMFMSVIHGKYCIEKAKLKILKPKNFSVHRN